MEQIVQPYYNINEKAGMCLSYARRVFGAGIVETTAWEGWTKAQFKHADRDFPAGLAVPVWFDWWGQLPGDNQKYQYGHVAIRAADGKVWSSPLSGVGRTWFNTVDDLVRAFGNGMRYVGWSEDISRVKVVDFKGVEVEKITRELENTMSFLATGDYPGVGYDYRFTDQPMTQVVMNQFVNFWLEASRYSGLASRLQSSEETVRFLLAAGANRDPESSKSEAEKKLSTLKGALKDVISG
ncbi:hypothetical protein F6X56_15225 [Rhodococcus erythropolis]|uniref:hypothetical protein n=1 Tax=Rhodococcus erythropolis TaxID=1833 RepID=UPI00059F66DE|nr:hypothetical protein [Rhodococcus erythropolis]QEX10974.1 hypothetical protein F6X56_15225 [Rhodococcus erythropolis]